MKRSEINGALTKAKSILSKHGCHLPPFALWTAEEWRGAGPDCDRIKLNDLGWAVTDFGLDDFENRGVVMFTFRNGNSSALEQGTPYAEKLLVLQPGQRVPLHLHWRKTEDIINRAGGILVMEVYRMGDDQKIDRESPVQLFCDGIERVVEPGQPFELKPGESVTITPTIFHRFWAKAEAGPLVCGEVSTVSNAYGDNLYGEPGQRFMEIEEDEAPIHLLSHEYPGSPYAGKVS